MATEADGRRVAADHGKRQKRVEGLSNDDRFHFASVREIFRPKQAKAMQSERNCDCSMLGVTQRRTSGQYRGQQ